MKRTIVLASLLSLVVIPLVEAQQKSLSSTMEIYVFPKSGQDANQQSQDGGRLL